MSKQETELFKIVIIRKSNKAVVKSFNLPFETPFDAMTWGEKQAEEFGQGHYAELVTKAKEK